MANVEQRGDTYRITVSAGYDLNGKQIKRKFTWKPEPKMTKRQLERELRRQVVLFEEKCRTGQVLDGNIRFADWAEKWISDYAIPQLGRTTVAGYQQQLKRILPAIGHMRIDRITPATLQAFYKNLMETGIREDSKRVFRGDFRAWLKKQGMTQASLAEKANISANTVGRIARGLNVNPESAAKIAAVCGKSEAELFDVAEKADRLSENSIQHYHKCISTILDTAVQFQMIPNNPCDRIRPPKIPHKEAPFLDDVQTEELLNLLEELPEEKLAFKTAVITLLFTGMRRSELLGLDWSDIDLETGVISIRKTSKYLPKLGVFEDDTKNNSSRRSIMAPSDLLPLLRHYQTWQLEQRMKAGDRWQNTDRVFTRWDGSPMRPDTLTSSFQKWIETTSLPEGTHLHTLRHTNATLHIFSGTNLQTIAKRLGHSSCRVTSAVYAHAVQTADAIAAESVAAFKLKKTGT